MSPCVCAWAPAAIPNGMLLFSASPVSECTGQGPLIFGYFFHTVMHGVSPFDRCCIALTRVWGACGACDPVFFIHCRTVFRRLFPTSRDCS